MKPIETRDMVVVGMPFDRLPERMKPVALPVTRLLIAAKVLPAVVRDGRVHTRMTPRARARIQLIVDRVVPVPVPDGWTVPTSRRAAARDMLSAWLHGRAESAARLVAAKAPPPPTTKRGRKKPKPLPARHVDTGPAERWQHGDHEPVDAYAIDPKAIRLSGTIVRRSVDTLAKLHASGAIAPDQLDAGRRFGADYSSAGLTLRSVDFQPKPRAAASDGYQAHLSGIRASVGAAIMALGGEGSSAAQAVIRVCGEGMTLREWSRQPRPNRRPVDERVGRGILIGALAVLASHYGPPERAPRGKVRLRRWVAP